MKTTEIMYRVAVGVAVGYIFESVTHFFQDPDEKARGCILKGMLVKERECTHKLSNAYIAKIMDIIE